MNTMKTAIWVLIFIIVGVFVVSFLKSCPEIGTPASSPFI